MTKVFNDSLELIGSTPMLKVNNIYTGKCNLYLKLESFNLGGSIKDRPAKNMILEAEKKGILKKGGTIVEATAGNTGIALAIIALKRGYKVIIVVPDKMTIEKVFHLRALGAEVITARSDVIKGHQDYYLDIAERIAKEKKAYYINQFSNKDNLNSHIKDLGPEIFRQLKGNVDAFVAGVGTGGTISGVGAYLKNKNKKCELILADPKGSILKDLIKKGVINKNIGSWIVEGIGEDFCPPLFDKELIDEAYSITDLEAIKTCNEILKKEGILAGSSSGTLISAAIKYCKAQTKSKNVVTLVCDAGDKYLRKVYNENWRIKNNFYLNKKKDDLSDLVSYKHNSGIMPSVDLNSTCSLAYKLMQENSLSFILVIDTNKSIKGIVNERSLLNGVIENSFDEKVKFFIIKIKKIQYDESINKVLKLMKKEDHLLVYKKKNFVGILNKEDILSYIKLK